MKVQIFVAAALILGFNASAFAVTKKCTGLPAQAWDRDSKGALNYRGQYKGLVIDVQFTKNSMVVTDPSGYFPGEYDLQEKGEGKFPAPVSQDYISYYAQIDDPFTWKVQKNLLSSGTSGIMYVTSFGGPEGNDYAIFNCEDK